MYTLSEITVGGINYSKKTYWHFVISVVSAILNTILVFILVPRLGGIGASISTAFSYIIFFYARTIISNYYYPINIDIKKVSLSLLLCLSTAYLNTFFSVFDVFPFNLFVLVAFIIMYFNELKILTNKLFLRNTL